MCRYSLTVSLLLLIQLKSFFIVYFSLLGEYVKYGEEHWWFHSHNTRLAQFCEVNHEVCWDAKFISSMCRLFPFQSVKTVRMRLKLAKSLLEDPK